MGILGSHQSTIRRYAFVLLPVATLLLDAIVHTPVSRIRLVTSQGDTTLVTAGAPRYRGGATLVSQVRIGGADATADEYRFSSSIEVHPLSGGSVVIIDRGPGAGKYVRVYDANGRYIRTLGRYGQGPGEYRTPSGLAELPDGRIVVRDGIGNRLIAYADTGVGERIFALNSRGETVGPDFLRSSASGLLYLSFRDTVPGAPSYNGGFLRIRADGRLFDTLPSPFFPDGRVPGLTASSETPGSRMTISVLLPFGSGATSALSPFGYFVTGRTNRYAVDLRVPRGARRDSATTLHWSPSHGVVSIRRNVPAVQISEAERTEERRRVEESMRARDARWQWSGPDIPRTKPFFRSIRVALDGRIWVELRPASERIPVAERTQVEPGRTQKTWREAVRYDVFEPSGAYHGEVSIPNGVVIRALRGDDVWGTTEDADGVLTVHRYRVMWRS